MCFRAWFGITLLDFLVVILNFKSKKMHTIGCSSWNRDASLRVGLGDPSESRNVSRLQRLVPLEKTETLEDGLYGTISY